MAISLALFLLITHPRRVQMDKEKIVMAMLEKINNDTRAMGVQSGVDLMQIEQQIMQNQGSMMYLLSNLHDFIIQKELFKEIP